MIGPLNSVRQFSWKTAPLVVVETQPFHRGHEGEAGQFLLGGRSSAARAAAAVTSTPYYIVRSAKLSKNEFSNSHVEKGVPSTWPVVTEK